MPTLDLEASAPNDRRRPGRRIRYANLDIPAGTGCDYTNFQTANNGTPGAAHHSPCRPGRYCGGLRDAQDTALHGKRAST